MKKPYKKVTYYLFEIDDVMWMASIENHRGEKFISIEEQRKNGQEDTHMSGVIFLDENGYYWDDDELPGSICEYEGEEMAKKILQYIKDNPII